MKGTTFDIYVDQYVFTVEVTDYHYQRPLGKWCDSDMDCYGYEELEYLTLGALEYGEDGEVVELSLSEAESLAEKLEDIITEKLLEEIRDYGDDC